MKIQKLLLLILLLSAVSAPCLRADTGSSTAEIRMKAWAPTAQSKARSISTSSAIEVGDTLSTRFFDDVSYSFVVTKVSTLQNITYVSGKTAGSNYANVSYIVNNGKIRVDVRDDAKDRSYILAYNSETSEYVAREINNAKSLLRCGSCTDETDTPSAPAFVKSFPGTVTANTPYSVGVLFVFDTTGKAYADAQGGMETCAAAIINSMNATMTNSKVNGSYYMAGVYHMSGETFSKIDDGLNVTSKSKDLRNYMRSVKADLVMSLSEPNDKSNISGLGVQGAESAVSAVSSIRISTAIIGYSSAHEAGHNFGCQHSRTQSSSPGSHAYAVGFENGGYCTLMSYGSSAGTHRIPLFSGPANYWESVLMGSATANNTRMMNEQIATVSQFGEAYAQTTESTTAPVAGSDPSSWNPSSASQSTKITMWGGDYFTISTNAAWLWTLKSYATYQGPVAVGVLENTGLERTGIITLTPTGGVPYNILVTQAGRAAKTYDLTVSSAGYSTLYLDYMCRIPLGVEAYVAAGRTGNVISMTPITDGLIPANTAVVLKAAAGTYTFTEVDASSSATAEKGVLQGVLTDTEQDDNSYYYVLDSQDGVVGFYQYSPVSTLHANRAFYVSATEIAGALRFSFNGVETAVGKVTTSRSCSLYDLQGRKAVQPQKGTVYLQNGKAVLVK